MPDLNEPLPFPLTLAARKWPDSPALIWENGRLTYAELERLVAGAGLWLRKLGLRPGDRIGLLARNSPEAALLLWAGLFAAVPVVPLNRRWPRESLRRAGLLADLRVLFADESSLPLARELGLPVEKLEELWRGASPASGISVLEPEREANILFTSGSTGEPKGVRLSVRSHYFNALGSNANLPLGPGQGWYAALPFYHVGGLAILYRCALAGAAAVVAPRFDEEELLAQIRAGRVTHLSVVPTMLARLLDAGLEKQWPADSGGILLGGAPTPPELLERLNGTNLPVLTTYGLTEAASQVTTLSPADPPEKRKTAGRLLPYRKVHIRREDGRLAGPGETGEIEVSGPVLFSGYLGESKNLSPEDWFATGDLGSLDEQGYLSVRGRKDDLIISGGENIFPAEIERVALRFPGVRACAAVGVRDTEWGERPLLFVEADAPEKFPLARFQAFLRENLPSLYRPERTVVLKQLPRISIGKIDRSRLKRFAPGPRESNG